MLIDTSGFLCKFEKNEIHHEKATEIYESATILLTSSYILAEFTALAHVRGIPRKKIIQFSEDVLADEKTDIVWVDAQLHRTAIELLKRRLDKSYSLCDAVSFVLMRSRGVNAALTTDKHFEQEGFVRLLKS